jgi:hypothetical protein
VKLFVPGTIAGALRGYQARITSAHTFVEGPHLKFAAVTVYTLQCTV